MDKKYVSRFFAVFLMGLFVVVVSIWALAHSFLNIKNGRVLNQTVQGGNNSLSADSRENEIVDMDNLGDNVLSRVAFETEIELIDDAMARGLIRVDDTSELKLYMGSGNYSDLLILVKAASDDIAKSDQEIVEQYLMDMRESFEAYMPEQAKKISDAYIARSGCYLAVCVTNDIDNAEKVILAAFK